jgi:hypothetical protein
MRYKGYLYIALFNAFAVGLMFTGEVNGVRMTLAVLNTLCVAFNTHMFFKMNGE